MTATIKFDESTIFGGFTVSYKISDDISKTVILSECYRRLESVLDSLNMDKMLIILRKQNFIIEKPLEDIIEGSVIYISSIAG